jgi:hypothetical protein
MITIYDYGHIEINVGGLISSVLIFLFGLFFYFNYKKLEISKKELETPYTRIDNLTELKEKQEKYKTHARGLALCAILFSIFMFSISVLKPVIYGNYIKYFKKHYTVSGFVSNYKEIHTLSTTYIEFKVNNIDFNLIKSSKYISTKTFNNGDYLFISYYDSKENNETTKQIVEIKLK